MLASKYPHRAFPRFLCIWILIPFILGYFVSRVHLDAVESLLKPHFDRLFPHQQDHRITLTNDGYTGEALKAVIKDCIETKLQNALLTSGSKDLAALANISFAIHRNGESESCGQTTKGIVDGLKYAVETFVNDFKQCPSFDRYSTESLLTRAFRELLDTSCPSPESDRSHDLGLYGFCDMGESRTPILLDHMKLVPITHKGDKDETFLPCHFHTDQGVRVTSLPQLVNLMKASSCSNDGADAAACGQVPLYAVQAGRVFLFAAAHVGQRIDLPHVKGGDPSLPVFLEVLSVRPAVFDLHNFFTKDESAELVTRALKETKESHRIKRSTTGDKASTENINQRRTSESGFDTSGATSMLIKRRCFDVLGFDEYLEGHADGLQILRYNLTTAYIPHMDWFSASESMTEDYDSEKKGGNRFATILLYMSDLPEGAGGETVFTEGWPADLPVSERVDTQTALEAFRASDQHHLVQKDSWQEKMVAQCRTRLAVRPNSARAVLFYSLLPNGKPDKMSEHGACPVLDGQKWAANLWTWSTPRPGYPGSPKRNSKENTKRTLSNTVQSASQQEEEDPHILVATFKNSGSDPATAGAALYYFDGATESFWGDLGHEDPPISINTYPTHIWRLKVGDSMIQQWTIDESTPKNPEFVV